MTIPTFAFDHLVVTKTGVRFKKGVGEPEITLKILVAVTRLRSALRFRLRFGCGRVSKKSKPQPGCPGVSSKTKIQTNLFCIRSSIYSV